MENLLVQMRGFCVIVDGIHLQIIAQHICTWSMAINNSDGNLETTPTALKKTLMPVKSGIKNLFRVSVAKSYDKNSNPILMQVQPLMQPLTQLPPYFHYTPHLYYPYNRYPHLSPPLHQLPYDVQDPEHHPQEFRT